MSAVVFDLDGTLIDSIADILAAVNTTLGDEGLPELSQQQVRDFVGNGIPTLIRRCLDAVGKGDDPALAAHIEPRLIARYEAATDKTEPYPHVAETLQALRDDGYRLAICTNKATGPTHAVLRALDLDRFFDAVICPGDPCPPKPDPAMLRAATEALSAPHLLFVGDSEVDAATAQAAGLPFALYTPGYRKSLPSEIPHDAAFDDFRQLPDIARRFAPRPE